MPEGLWWRHLQPRLLHLFKVVLPTEVVTTLCISQAVEVICMLLAHITLLYWYPPLHLSVPQSGKLSIAGKDVFGTLYQQHIQVGLAKPRSGFKFESTDSTRSWKVGTVLINALTHSAKLPLAGYKTTYIWAKKRRNNLPLSLGFWLFLAKLGKILSSDIQDGKKTACIWVECLVEVPEDIRLILRQ